MSRLEVEYDPSDSIPVIQALYAANWEPSNDSIKGLATRVRLNVLLFALNLAANRRLEGGGMCRVIDGMKHVMNIVEHFCKDRCDYEVVKDDLGFADTYIRLYNWR